VISHKHKCIFIHIPRCGGTSIECDIIGQDWFHTSPQNNHTPYYGYQTKHICASTAKRIYAEYWNEYFKFTFIRNPWMRMLSMNRYPKFYGVEFNSDNTLDLTSYFEKFLNGEFDIRCLPTNYNKKYIKNSVYLNYIDEKLDFIGRFETLHQDFDYICEKLNVTPHALPYHNRTKNPRLKNNLHYSTYYNEFSRRAVETWYKKDIEYFNYDFETP
jgi:hypothetical protein